MAIETAAMEDLLEKLLKQTQANGLAYSQAFAKLAKSSGLDPKTVENTQSKLKKLGDSADDTSNKISRMEKAGVVVGSVLGDLAAGAGKTVGNLVDFAAKAALGTASLSDFFTAFKDLPIVGSVAGLFAALAKVQEENLNSYRSLSKAGINFGQALGDLRTTATQLGLTQEQYVKLMTSNADAFAMMGSTANQGARNFRSINLELTRTGGVGEQLRNLGFGFEEMNYLTASYVRVTGGLSKQQQQQHKEVAAAVAEYGKELDLIARVTGKSREMQEKALQEEMEEANWQAFLAGQDEKTREKLKSQINDAIALAGKGGAQIAKAQAMGIAVQGEAGQLITSTAGQLAEHLRKNTDRAMNATVSVEEFRNGQARRLGEGQAYAAEAYERLKGPLGAMALQGDKVADTLGPLAQQYSKYKLAGDRSIEDTIARVEAERKAAAADATTRDKELAAALEAEAAMRDFQAAMQDITNVLIRDVLNPLLKEITPHMPEITEKIKEFAEWLKKWIPKLFNDQGRQEIIDNVTKALSDIMSRTWNNVIHPTIDKGQDEKNLSKMTGGEKAFSYLLRGIEAIGDFMGLGDLARASRISKETEGTKDRAGTSWGMTGKLIEDFGNGTDVTLHGNEGVINGQQISDIMEGGASIKLKATIDRLNTINEQILAQMKMVAENTERTLEATKALNGNAFA
jgi:hypothetical protein